MSVDYGLSLLDAAKEVGVHVADAREPEDRYVDVDGLKLHYLDWGGDGKPKMLCLHGAAQNAHMWDFTALAYCDRYHVLSLDQRGHGDSGWAPDEDYGRDAHQRDISGFVEALGLDNFVLVGLSMGGSNAITYTAGHPDKVRALVAVDIGPETRREGVERIGEFVTQEDVLDSFDAFVDRTQRYSPLRPAWQIRGSLQHNLRQLPDGRWTWKYDPVLRDPQRRALRMQGPGPEERWATWERVQCPTLIVRGGESDVLSADVAQRMQQRLPGSRLVEVARAGHRVPGDNPVDFERALGEFLKEMDNAAD